MIHAQRPDNDTACGPAFLFIVNDYGCTISCFIMGFVLAKFLMSDMQVSLKCGSAEKLMKVEEPSRCEYIATLLTPAACTPTEVQAVQDKLTMLNQELEGDHSEL